MLVVLFDQPFHSVIVISQSPLIYLSPYLPCIQYKIQNAVAYGCRAAMMRHPQFLMSQNCKILHFMQTSLKPISVYESKRLDKSTSGNFIYLSTFISST